MHVLNVRPRKCIGLHFNTSVLRLLISSGLLLGLAVLSACGGSSGGVEITDRDPVPAARGTLPSLARSSADFEGEHHAGSGACAACHTDPGMTIDTPIPGQSRNVSIGTAWETSLMANATRDPYWHAVVASELDNFPELEDVINDKCIVCHAPTAHDLAKKENLELRLFDKVSSVDGSVSQGLLSMTESDELFNHAMDGVTCTLCHQMDGANFGTEEGMTGGFVILGSPTGDPNDRPAYGQYSNPEVGYMRNNVGFLAQYGPHLSTSESCATCHNLNIEPVDESGNKLEGAAHFAEQAIFSEWQNSDYAVGGSKEANCQSCHMPKVDQAVYISQGATNKREGFAEHTFLGANTVMQDMLMNFSDELGIDPELDFAGSIARNREFLTTSADVTLSPAGGVIDDTLSFDVNIENLTGHKLPSGYHSRRVYLHVQVLDAAGQLVFESGRIRPDGSIVGVSEDVNPAVWEPHYDLITSETQVQVYQAIVGNSDNERTHSLLSGSFYLKDNRLTPAGMDKALIRADNTLPDTFGTFGEAFDDPDFNDGRDTVTYQVSVPGPGVYTVSAELRYQPLSFGHLQKLWTQGDRVDQVDNFRTIYDGTTLRDEVIDTATQVMQ
ncbi:MAG: hypothetical protein HKN42_10790 [Granulosicoccus sp.]|nr:hypothetical protein [Granulosicoccus sp.]